MAAPATSPVEDSVPKINEEVAVGEDLVFQRKWWIFERSLWVFFALLLVATALGCFGRGYFARAEARSSDGALSMKYDRIQRTGTPSDITVSIGESAMKDGAVRVFVSESLLTKLGAERVSPQPDKTFVGTDGLTYVFPALQLPAKIIFSVAPSGPGKFPFTITLPDTKSSIQTQIYVMP